MDIAKNFIEDAIKQAKFYRQLGQKTIDQQDDDGLFWSGGDSSNSIAVITKHLWGNMLSRWTHFRTEDGEKPWRQRDAEFDDDIQTREELQSKWNEGWNCFIGALESIKPDELETLIYIRNEGHTILEAVQRQIPHYAYHVGQVVFIGKMMKGNDWNSLSIPKGESEKFNQEKFKKDKSRKHFTDK